MILFRMDLFFHGALMLSHMQQAALDGITGEVDDIAGTVEPLKEFSLHLRECGLRASHYALDGVIGRIEDRINTKYITEDIRFFNQTIAREMKETPFFSVPTSRAIYGASPDSLFGEKLLKVFPSIRDEVEDAALCIYFGRGTASVFHLMRVMEVGLQALAARLGVPYAPSWESYLSQIKSRIEAKHKTKSVRWKRDEPFFRDVLGDLQSVKIAWRNPTMHIVRRYTPEEADEVFRAVRTLIEHLV